MTLPPDAGYLQAHFRNHLNLFFSSEVVEAFDHKVRFIASNALDSIRESIIAIPYDILWQSDPEHVTRVEFNHTTLTLWNCVAPPDSSGWTPIPDAGAPLWYRNAFGTIVPAWNLFGNCYQLLTFGEEGNLPQPEAHGRFVGKFSPRNAAGLLDVPAVNEAIAVVAAAAIGLRRDGHPAYSLDGHLKPPVVVLSHDCDILAGNDWWTQAVRGFRVVAPLRRMRPPAISNLWWIARNAITPHRFYFDNVTGMIDLERCFGYNSTLYLLNGNGGRFGARNRFSIIPELLRHVPDAWPIGMHYNYDTFLDDGRFVAQRDSLREAVGKPLTSGRAHYLRFDPDRSLPFLAEHEIKVDESSGYPDTCGFRNGLGGCFQVFDRNRKRTLGIWEVPLVVMDAILVGRYGDSAVAVVASWLRHLSRIGGAITILFHPGQFNNPEHSGMIGIYHRILIECRQVGAESWTAGELVDRFRKHAVLD